MDVVDLKKFIVDNNIIGTMAGVAIALYTKDLILSFSSDIVVPSMNNLLLKLNIKSLTAILPHKVKLNVTVFLQNFISWFLGVLITYIFIQYTVKKLFGISEVEKAQEKEKEKEKENEEKNKNNI